MAVRLCKLAPDEAQRAFPRRGQQDLSDSMAALGELQPGAAAAIERAGLSDRAIKRRLGAAAQPACSGATKPLGGALRAWRAAAGLPFRATSHPRNWGGCARPA